MVGRRLGVGALHASPFTTGAGTTLCDTFAFSSLSSQRRVERRVCLEPYETILSPCQCKRADILGAQVRCLFVWEMCSCEHAARRDASR